MEGEISRNLIIKGIDRSVGRTTAKVMVGVGRVLIPKGSQNSLW